MSAKTKPPRRLFRSQSPLSLNEGLIEVAAEDLAASPCIVCAKPAAFIAMWSPSPEIVVRELGGDPTAWRRLIYRLCGQCSARCEREKEFVLTVEAAVLKLWRGGYVHRFRSGGQ
jgi:hypothetical protein